MQTTAEKKSMTPDMVSPLSLIKNAFLDAIPLSLILWLAKPYLAGHSAGDAIARAHKLFSQDHFSSTIDILGEDLETQEQCQASVITYKELIKAISSCLISSARGREQISVSIKPSMFSEIVPTKDCRTSAKFDEAYERISQVVDCAFKHNLSITLEAEDNRWTDFQLDTYKALINRGYTNLGTVLQSRLLRTRADIKKFDERMRVRLVIGIYNEPKEIAETRKSRMKELLVEYARALLANGTYVEMATHDSLYMEQFFRQAVIPEKSLSCQFEAQFLLGVPRRNLQDALVSGAYFVELSRGLSGAEKEHAEKLALTGCLVRMYLPYGTNHLAAAYCKRRLKANPHMISYGIKNFLNLPG